MIPDHLCGCGCGLLLPAGKRYGALYFNRHHKQNAMRQRQKERVAGYVDLCVECGHPEEFHTLRPEDIDKFGPAGKKYDFTELACSQINCKCNGYVPQAPLNLGELNVA